MAVTSERARQRRPTLRPSGRRTIALAAAGVLVAWLVLALGVRMTHGGEALPGTEVAGADLAGAAEDEVRQRIAAAPGNTVTLTHGPARSEVRGADAGLDVDASAERALSAGREGPLLGLWSTVAGLVTTRAVEPVYRSDRAARAAVAEAAKGVDEPPSYGAIAIDGETLDVSTSAPRAGRTVDREATSAALLAALRRGGGGDVPMTVRERPTVTPEDVRAVAQQAERYLETGLQAGPVAITPEQLALVLALEHVRKAAEPRVRLGVRKTPLRELVAEIAADHDREPANARISAAPQTGLLTEQLDVSWRPRAADVQVERSRAGRAVEQEAAAAAIARAVRADRDEAKLPVRAVPPSVATAAARDVTKLIGTFTTAFACCEPRATNIRLIAEAVDGTVIAPGAQFSLNGVAGERTREKGYLPAPFIADGKLVPSVGGGVSQMATTVFNAAYFAGLQLDGFMAHSFYISRYPPGREATLNFPDVDLAWTNDTDAPVLVRSTVTDTSVTVSLYGDNGGRRVASATGERQPVAGRDFSITVTRTITHDDGRVASQPYTTTYDNPPPPDED